MTRYERAALVAVLVILAGGCEGVEPDARPTLELEGEETAVAGEAVTVRAVASDDNGLTRLVVRWGDGAADTIPLSGASATEDVGHAFATLGAFTVEARVFDDGGQEAVSAVTVEVGPASIVIEPAVDTVNALGFTTALTATAYDAGGGELAEFVPEWESLDPARATVGTAGVVTAVAPGTARIRVASGGAADTVTVVIRQVPKAVVLTAPDTLGVRAWGVASAVVTDSNDVTISGAEVAFSSTAPDVAAVDAAGELTGVAEGTAIVVAAAGSVADSATVEVALALLFSAPLETGYNELFTMTRHGTGLRNLTNYEYSDLEGVWSPDRRSIAFWSSRTESGVIMVMDADGSNTREIHTGLGVAHDFAWSPDGAAIAFAGRPDGFADDIYVIGPDGSGLTQLTADTAHEVSPAWSPDGTRIAFQRVVDGNGDIHVMAADGSEVVNLTSSPAVELAPVWSPDGTEIAFSSNRSGTTGYVIHRMNADGSDIRQIGEHHVMQFDWSPDGALFLFWTDVDEQRDIFTLPVDGGTLTPVTNDLRNEQDVRWR